MNLSSNPLSSLTDNVFFQTTGHCKDTFARTGRLQFASGVVETPVFMPVGTRASIKALSPLDITELGYDLILTNTYHLYLRPGEEVLEKFQGVKNFMNYHKAMLTDSGGYQIFSLSGLFQMDRDGVNFQSHLDGSRHRFTPERVLEIQNILGSDIHMVLDDCAPYGSDKQRIATSLERTHSWAKRSIAFAEKTNHPFRVFGIVQGGTHLESRLESLKYIQSLPFPGIAQGGLSVGEPREELVATLEGIAPHLDANRPRYLMGVGTVPDILDSVRNGIDMFDCVLPTRNARNAQVFTSEGKKNLRNEKYKFSDAPIDPNCTCKICKTMSIGYLRHLHKSEEILALSASTFHNLHFMKKFMEDIRKSIVSGEFKEFYLHWKNLFVS